jgi:hypothetical protein
MKSESFNFLEPSGPLQACNGTVLTLLYLIFLEPSGPLQAGNGADCFTLFFSLVTVLFELSMSTLGGHPYHEALRDAKHFFVKGH